MSDNTATLGSHNSTDIFGSSLSCFYSEANVLFDVPAIRSIGTSAGEPQTGNAPVSVLFPVRGGPALATEIAQLLIDIQAADDRDVTQWLKTNEGRPPDEIIDRRIRRFTEAFSRVALNKRDM
jgi:hypothetical protein